MKVLFLDDDPTRHRTFKARSIGHVVHYATTASEAIEAFKQHGPFDVASLDHDLGGDQMVQPGTPGHGQDVAEFLRDNPHLCRTVYIHSYNEPAARFMAYTIESSWRTAVAPVLNKYRIRVMRMPFCGWSPNYPSQKENDELTIEDAKQQMARMFATKG